MERMERMERLDRSQRGQRLEVTCRKFAVLSGIRQDADDLVTCAQPRPGSRKGTLVLLTEPAGEHPSLANDACKLAQRVIVEHYMADNSLSLTSGFLGALDAANSAVLGYNYAGVQVEQADGEHSAGATLPVQTGNVRARHFKVGLTAAMLRADGTGVYLSQMAPAQCYIRHNGLAVPLPETPSWRSPHRTHDPKRMLSLVREADEETAEHEELEELEGGELIEVEDEGEFEPDYTQENLLPPALGTAPGMESDLIYRRVEDGDLIVLVSTSLARFLDRDTADMALTAGDADAVADALYDIATSNGVAQAHACVISLGGRTSSGVDTVWSEPEATSTTAPEAESVGSTETRITYAPGRVQSLRNGLLSPKTWLVRKQGTDVVDGEQEKAFDEGWEGEAGQQEPVAPSVVEGPWLRAQEQEEEDAHEGPPAGVDNSQGAAADASEDVEVVEDRSEQHSLPPYLLQAGGHYVLRPTSAANAEKAEKAAQRPSEAPLYAAPVLWGDGDEEESAPPQSWRTPASHTGTEQHEAGKGEAEATVFPWQRVSRMQPLSKTQPPPRPAEEDSVHYYPAPVLFSPHTGGNGPAQALPVQGGVLRYKPAVRAIASTRSALTRLPKISLPKGMLEKGMLSRVHFPSVHIDFARIGRNVAAWISHTAKNLLPERALQRVEGGGNRLRSANLTGWLKNAVSGKASTPVRIATAVVIVIVLGLLAWSVLKAISNHKEAQVNTYLDKAKQEELLANQPSTSDSDRIAILGTALQNAKQALTADPASNEARLLATKVETELDTAQGITRFSNVTPLFNLTAQGATATGQATPAPITAVVPGQVDRMLILGSNAFVLEAGAGGHIYKCGLQARSCAPTLAQGDSAGGQKVGNIVAMTVVANNVTALDDKLSVYTYNSDANTWQAQQLGDADKLQAPKDIASYDGNLYLLNAKAGQISKYLTGKFGQPSADWLKGATDTAQLSNATAFAIDGSIYTLLTDGKILVLQGGTIQRTITPKLTTGTPSTSTQDAIYTSTDIKDLYVLHASDGSITRITKDGQTVATYKAPLAQAQLQTLTGMAVDETGGKFYLIGGKQVYLATLAGQTAGTQNAPQPAQQPNAVPTIAP